MQNKYEESKKIRTDQDGQSDGSGSPCKDRHLKFFKWNISNGIFCQFHLVPCLQMDHIKPRALGLGHTLILFPHPPAMTAGIRAPSLKSEDMKKRNIGWFYPQRPQGASLSTFLGWLNHWVITQRHPHKCATIGLDLSRISQHFLHLWNFHFQMSQALIQVFFT